MLRVRLKADGRIVEILPDGSERPMLATGSRVPSPTLAPSHEGEVPSDADTAAYSRRLRGRSKLTQAEFASRIGVPIETVRNWEQGKRSPRGPARALLKVIEQAPDLVFAALAAHRVR
jgi:putative transcriptional regulator